MKLFLLYQFKKAAHASIVIKHLIYIKEKHSTSSRTRYLNLDYKEKSNTRHKLSFSYL